MSSTLEVLRGHDLRWPVGNLVVKLSGRTGGLLLKAVTRDGQPAGSNQDGPDSVLLVPGDGSCRFAVETTSSTPIPAGTRVGLELRLVTGAAGGDLHASVPQRDAGGFSSIDLMWVTEGPEGRTLSVEESRDAFAHLLGGTQPPARVDVDERAFPWVVAGRYGHRVATGRDMTWEPVASWGLLLDSSPSMGTGFEVDELVAVIEGAAGVLVEAFGGFPSEAGLTGTLEPVWIDAGREDPGILAREAAQKSSGTSWCTAAPALDHAASKGWSSLLLVTDSLPADLALCRSHPVQLLVVVLGTGVTARELEEAGIPSIRVASLAAAPTESDWELLGGALAGSVPR